MHTVAASWHHLEARLQQVLLAEDFQGIVRYAPLHQQHLPKGARSQHRHFLEVIQRQLHTPTPILYQFKARISLPQPPEVCSKVLKMCCMCDSDCRHHLRLRW